MILTDKKGGIGSYSYAKLAECPVENDGMIEFPVGLNSRGSTAGHGGADEKMLADFIKCVKEGIRPVLDVNFGIKMSLPGIIAEQSYKQNSALLEIPKI